jgi:hypothetical protein
MASIAAVSAAARRCAFLDDPKRFGPEGINEYLIKTVLDYFKLRSCHIGYDGGRAFDVHACSRR